MSKLRCPDCKTTYLAKAGKDELECTKCGFSGYTKDFLEGDCMKTILYSDDKEYYYVKEFATPRDFWLSVRKHPKRPNATNWVSDAVQFENSYFRMILYFTFWKIQDKLHLQELVSESNELVRDYLDVQTLYKPKEKIFNPSLRKR